MAKIMICGTTFTIESTHSLDDLNKVASYKPDALHLDDENGNPYFFVLPGTFGNIQSDGIIYADTAPDGSGKAVVTIPLPPCKDGQTVKSAVAAKYGPVICNANKVEKQIADALEEVNAMLASVEANIVMATES